MNTVKKLNKWANAHTYYGIDLLRILVGVFLVWKGISFITNTEYYDYYAEPLKKIGGGMIIIHYVVAANMVGGVMLIFGLLTRWVIFSQLPILLGAILINFIGKMEFQNLILSISIFVICLFFLMYGSGRHSADYYFKMQQ
ncbi:DoxX family protein [Flavobacterium sp.]|jgi:putative oxidoreductase|uniref:DoxX family protein n=1 Tax=Flavobacterium sp. TaxID=239 RepID=UPI0038FC0884